MITPIHKKLNETIARLTTHADAETKEIIEDLLRRLYPFERLLPVPADDSCRRQGFWSTKGGLVIVELAGVRAQLLSEEGRAEIRNNQFLTQEENRLYCQGTHGLLALLTQYGFHETQSAVIVATPDALVREERDGQFQACMTKSILDQHYGPERSVSVMIVMDDAAITMHFEQEVHIAETA